MFTNFETELNNTLYLVLNKKGICPSFYCNSRNMELTQIDASVLFHKRQFKDNRHRFCCCYRLFRTDRNEWLQCSLSFIVRNERRENWLSVYAKPLQCLDSAGSFLLLYSSTNIIYNCLILFNCVYIWTYNTAGVRLVKGMCPHYCSVSFYFKLWTSNHTILWRAQCVDHPSP